MSKFLHDLIVKKTKNPKKKQTNVTNITSVANVRMCNKTKDCLNVLISLYSYNCDFCLSQCCFDCKDDYLSMCSKCKKYSCESVDCPAINVGVCEYCRQERKGTKNDEYK